MTWSSGLAGRPSTIESARSSSGGKNGETVAPDAAMPPMIRPAVADRHAAGPGNAASGEMAAKPAATGGRDGRHPVQVLGARDLLGRGDPGLGAGPAHAARAALVHARRR